MTTKPIFLILGIVRSKLTKHVAPHVLDESLAAQIKSSLQKIGEGIQQLKLKDLKLSQNLLECLVVRLKNKFGEECSQSSNESLGAEIERELKSTQTSAMSAFHSGLGSVEQVTCIKIILMTECFLVLNTLSSLHTIADNERDTFAVRLKSAREICDMELQKLNTINEVTEYLKNKLAPGVKQKRISVRRASSLGSGPEKTKAGLTREVIAMNFYVRLFFYDCQEKLIAATNSGGKTRKPAKSGKIGKYMKGLDVLGPAWSQGVCKGEGLLAGQDFVAVSAAFSVMKQDEVLAQLIENYVLCLDNTKQSECMEQLKKFLPGNKGVQKSVGKRKRMSVKKPNYWSKLTSPNKKEKEDRDEVDGDGEEAKKKTGLEARYLDVLNRLCAPSVIDSYLLQTSCGVDGATSVVLNAGVNIVPTPIAEVSLHWKDKHTKSM